MSRTRLQRSSVAAQSRDPKSHTVPAAFWAPAQQRTTPRRRVALAASGARGFLFVPLSTPSPPRGVFRPSFAVRFALVENKGRREGRAPAGWFYGLWRALPGERCTIAPVALRITDARTRLGRCITASLDAQTPGVRTTRFCRPRTPLPGQPEARACSPPTPKRNAVTAPCRAADRNGSRDLPALPSPHAPALPRPSHPGLRIVTIAKRPFDGPGWNAV
ncbi:hypothetical protein GGD64_007779 [Bradyrhizobium sp. CIR3A]|nr:hypothetical protein [Bradyrhizobium sp. CIR3A]NYG50396.1 hypothetical protein [Bradyrhizobium sp. IAR9]